MSKIKGVSANKSNLGPNTKVTQITKLQKAPGTLKKTIAKNGNKLMTYTETSSTGRTTLTHEQFAKPKKTITAAGTKAKSSTSDFGALAAQFFKGLQ